MTVDSAYRDLLTDILDHGSRRNDRTRTGTLAVFGRTLDLDVQRDFPLLGLRRLSFRIVALELQWMLRGIADPAWLKERNVHLWDPWVAPEGGLGPTVGQQWRSWAVPGATGIDQLQTLLDGLHERPHSRRHLLSAWNVAELPNETASPQANARQGHMALAPCLVTQQFFADEGRLSLQVYQRSADVYLGLPLDIASSALLLHLVARFVGLVPHRLRMCLGDTHLYLNHLEQARELLRRGRRRSLCSGGRQSGPTPIRMMTCGSTATSRTGC
jgi:thymidylate synthase